MPTPSPPKRSVNFGQKTVDETDQSDQIEFSVEDGSEGPHSSASPQTVPAQNPTTKPKGKKKKVKIIKPFPTATE